MLCTVSEADIMPDHFHSDHISTQEAFCRFFVAAGFAYDHICHLFSGHQIVYALHMDSAHCHLHFVVNSVSFEDGKKHFSGFHDLFPVRDFLQECFPRSNVHIYQSFPDSDVNRFGCSDDDELLRID